MAGDKYVFDEFGLRAEVVGDWAVAKYDLIRHYAEMFTTSMRGKWGNLVYLDLFAGPGRARLESNGFVDSSPSIALALKCPFSRYVFCDVDSVNVSTLQERVSRFHRDCDARFIVGDANDHVEDVLASLPAASRAKTRLGFCLLDPYNLRSLRFTTVERLASIYLDILVLVPSYMDANRNRAALEQPENTVVEDFLGRPDWRSDWGQLEARRGVGAFGRFIANQFVARMALRGLTMGARRVVRFENRLKLYHLLGFSRHERGLEFWRIAERRTDPVRKAGQLSLFEDNN